MEKRYYNAEVLHRTLIAFEHRYGLESKDFYARYEQSDHEALRAIAGYHRHAWASFYREWRGLSGEDFASSVERDVQYAA